MPAKKAVSKKPIVIALSKFSAHSGYHEVHCSECGDIDKGKIKKFRVWAYAKKFAQDVGKKWGVKPHLQYP